MVSITLGKDSRRKNKPQSQPGKIFLPYRDSNPGPSNP
jgi:hypothetical protein